MEHEDNAHLDFLQNSQNLMDNLQIASGGGVCGEVGGIMVTGEEIGIGSISGKFEEHEEHDDHGEWKYIKEVQQSEKEQQQTTMKVDDAGKNVYGNDGNEEGVGNGNSNGNGDAGEHEVSTAAANFDVDVVVDEEEVEIIKNDGDFSTTSNTTSTVGEDEDIVGSGAGGVVGVSDMLQVEMKIETQSDYNQDTLHPFGGEELEEEEPSSLATNTTNGTSSLSENPPPQQQHEHEPDQHQEQTSIHVHQDKENVDPLTTTSDNNSPTHPTDFDFELHSQLNPDAKEFVPSFGSSPTSPTNPNAVVTFESLVANVGEPANIEADIDVAETSPFFEQQPHPAAAAAGIVARHLIGAGGDDDDFVAQSPRKGRGSNMDAISLPAENEFEHEVAKRPHELEQEDDIIAVSLQQQQEQQQQSHEQFGSGNVDVDNSLENKSALTTTTEDCLDFQSQTSTAVAFADHGPETSVDLDLDIDLQPDVIKQSLYMANETAEEPIEHILNTVQQLPTDFGDEIAAVAGEKELYNVEEKEIVSHSPSTEEMQMNLQNDFHSSASARDIPQIPIDMDNAAHMQGSFYMENTSADALQQQLEYELEQEAEQSALAPTDESLLIDTTLPISCNVSDISFEAVRTAPNFELQAEDATASTDIAAEVNADPASLNLFAAEFTAEPISNAAAFTNIDATPSPTEEKHLMEDTKEKQLLADSAALTDGLHEVQQQMNDLLLTNDGNLSQIEEVAQTATTIVDHLNPFMLQENAQAFDVEPEIKQQHAEEPQQHVEQQQQDEHEHQLQPDVLQFEKNYENEQQQQHFNELLLKQDEEMAHPIEEAFQQVKTPEVEAISPAPVQEEAFIEKAVAAEEESTEAAAPIAIEAVPIVEAAAAGAAIIGAVAATAAVAKSAVTAAKKTEPAKKPTAKIGASSTTAATKPKVSDASKKAAGGTTSRTTTAATTAARPRTAPAKTNTHTVEKKTTTTATTAAAARPATTTRKPLTSSTTHTTTASRLTSSKPTAARPTTAPTSTASKTSTAARSTAPPTARTSTLATARKTTTATTTNGTAAAAKPRLSTGTSGAGTSAAPTKPTTLGLSTTAKPKLSPRATLSSQLRKASGPPTAAKSPSKATAPTTNGITKSSTTATSSVGGRTMKSISTTTTSTTTKTFTARPAPKTAITATTARRTTLGTSPAAGTTGSNTNNTKHTTTTTKSTLSARSPMSRPASGRLSLSPTKALTLKSKSTSTKDATKKATPLKTAANSALKGGKQPSQQKDSTAVSETNGTASAVIMEGDELQFKEQVVAPHLNGGGDGVGLGGASGEQHLLLELENGNHNGGGDARDEEFNLLLEQQKAEGALIDA